jgi:DNA-binding NarL/FixJ family response regulator
MADGLSDRQIAEKLVIAVNTVKNHILNILNKLGTENRTRAVIIAIRKGLLSTHTPQQNSHNIDKIG